MRSMILGEEKMPSGIVQKAFNCSYLDEISLSGLFLRSKIPSSQKSLANNYVTIKKIFSYTVVQPKVTNVEYNRLKEKGFCPLESTNEEKMYDELMKIIDWANSSEKAMIKLSDEIFQIRVKELKYIFANVSSARLYELDGGYKILDKYLEFIAG